MIDKITCFQKLRYWEKFSAIKHNYIIAYMLLKILKSQEIFRFIYDEMFDVSLANLFVFPEEDQEKSEDREAVAVKVARVLRGKNIRKVRKLKVFLDEIL
jgi:hypothetical protein